MKTTRIDITKDSICFNLTKEGERVFKEWCNNSNVNTEANQFISHDEENKFRYKMSMKYFAIIFGKKAYGNNIIDKNIGYLYKEEEKEW